MELSDAEKEILLRGGFNLAEQKEVRKNKIGCCRLTEYENGLVRMQFSDLEVFLPPDDVKNIAKWILQ